MNAQDMLALARCCAAMLLNDHPLEWEDVPNVEQAGTRGRGLWEATL